MKKDTKNNSKNHSSFTEIPSNRLSMFVPGLTHGMGIEGGVTDRLGALFHRKTSNRPSLSPRYTELIEPDDLLNIREISFIDQHKNINHITPINQKYKQNRNLTINEGLFQRESPISVNQIQKIAYKKNVKEGHKISTKTDNYKSIQKTPK